MIGFERSTKNERDVLREALELYATQNQAAKVRARTENTRAAHEWREYQAEAILQHLARQ